MPEYLRVSRNVRGNRTRAEILDKAWDLISEQGADAKISEIAKAVGVSRQAIYVHFNSRGGLLVELVKRADERFEIKEAFDAALAIDDPKDRLIATLDAWLVFVPKIYPVAKDLIRLQDTDPEASIAWNDRMSDLRRWLLTLTKSLRRDGALKTSWTPEKAGQFFWTQSSVQAWGLLRYECCWSEKEIASRLKDSLVSTLLKE